MPERSKKITYPGGIFDNSSNQNRELFQIARVTDIILNPDHPRFLEFGGFSSIGTIFYEIENLQGSNTGNNAKPFYSNISSYPLINELVLLVQGPNYNIGSSISSKSYYYINTFNIWNTPHHNAYPNPILPIVPEKNNTITLNSPFNISQQTFIERNDIHPLLPFAGDIIYEGRWGNSIRFGSTSNPNPIPESTLDKPPQTTPQSSSPSSLLSDSSSQTFTSGNSNLSENFKNSLLKLNNFVFSKSTNDSNFTLKSVSVVGGESQVTNPSGIPKGGLAKSRADRVLNLIRSEYNSLQKNLTSTTVIGSTPYIQGQDKPGDLKYTQEQFVRVKILFSLTKNNTDNTTEPSSPPPTPLPSTPILNDWSNVGKNGDPIVILRNGQDPSSPNEGFISITEDINEDLSSIYLTSTQKIPIKVASQRYFSYNQKETEIPISPSQYEENQVIINSGRLVFNSKKDHILLSSQKTISFEAIKGFNFDTPSHFIIDVGTQIKLGSKDATEPLVKGETLRQELFNLCTNLKQLVSILKYQQSWPGGGAVPDNQLSVVASNMELSLESVLKSFDKDQNDNSPILSKVSKTI